MSVMIQVLLAAVMTASGLLLSSAVQAEVSLLSEPTEYGTAACPSVMPVVVARIDLDMPHVSFQSVSPGSAPQVIPEHCLDFDTLMPMGSYSWAGLDEATELMAAPMEERKDLKTKTTKNDRADEPDMELLTAAPAPEPPTGVLAAAAVVAGGVLNRVRRRVA
jgi:hypothetical protein